MSIKSKVVASAQGVGQSTAVSCDTTPFMAKDSALCFLESTGDRAVKLQKSEDSGATWTDVAGAALAAGGSLHVEVQMSDQHRIDVSGGTTGNGNCSLFA